MYLVEASNDERPDVTPPPPAGATDPGPSSADVVTVEQPDTPPRIAAVPESGDALAEARDRHPSAGLARHLDRYLDSVAEALQACGVIAGPPQRTDSASHLIGSIVIDCSTVRSGADGTGPPRPPAREPLGGPVCHGRSAPVIVAWDEDFGWVVGLHHDSVNSSRRYLHPDLLPAPTDVAEFVVGLALGQPLGEGDPVRSARPDPHRLRLVR